ncbi:hypothetical protein CEK25_004882 [Fusarium fujikuroi]|nr:hypothetical protein CEK25_004882 [Fusarium fujikuroi]
MAACPAGMVSAQTFTDCNLKKSAVDICYDIIGTELNITACPALSRFDNEVDATTIACDAFHGMIGTDQVDRGALFRINKESDALRSDNYLFFGRVDVVVQAAKGQHCYLRKGSLTTYEVAQWVGGDDALRSSHNYFSKGDTTTYDRLSDHAVAAPLTTTHTQDGVNEFPSDSDAGQADLDVAPFGGKNSNETRVGYTDFDAPAYYKRDHHYDYAGKDGPWTSNKGAKTSSDKTGDWTSIRTSDNDDDKTTSTTEVSKTKTAEATTSAVETTSAHESKTKSAEKESKTESAKETKTSEVATTFATATSTKAEATATATEGSGSGSESDAGAGAATATGSGASPSEPATTPVPVNSGSRMAGSVVAAFAGLIVAQILI